MTPTIVRRRRLIARLHELVHHRLLLIVAPAGYGKSTLLTDFTASCAEDNVALTVCTYTADAWDAEGLGLLAGIARAFAAEFPGAGQQTLHLLEQARAGTAAGDLDRLMTSAAAVLVEEVTERVPDYTLLVVDDYHLLDTSEPATRLVGLLLERLPAHVHVALLSRTVPALDTSALLAAEQLAGLGPRDLAFSEDELALVLKDRYGIDAKPEQLEELHRHTEGWITGLLLAMPALPPGLREDPQTKRLEMLLRTLSGARRGGVALGDYLAAEMLRRQAPEDRDLLLAASLPDEVDPAQLDEVAGVTGSALALSRLERGGVPLTAVAASAAYSGATEVSGNRFRLHALLRQYLRTHLERNDPPRYDRLRRRWTEVAEAHGQTVAALEHALAARWWPRAATLLERHGDEWIDRGRHRFVEVALAALPADVLATHPRVQVCRGRLTFARGAFPAAIECARAAFVTARARRDRGAEARALLLEAIATQSSGRAAEAHELCVHALEHPAVRREKPLLAEALRYLAFVEGTRGFLELAIEHLKQSLALYERLGRRWDLARLLGNLGVASRQLGRSDEAERCHTRALAIRRELGDPFEISLCLNNLAMIQLHRGAFAEAETLVQEAIETSERAGYVVGVACWRVTQGDILRALNRPEEALSSYRSAHAGTGQAVDPRWTAWAYLGEAAVHLTRGEVDPAAESALTALESSTRAGLREIEGHANALLAAIALQRGRRRDFNQRLEVARLAARETGSKELAVRVQLWSGLNALQQSRSGEALAALQLAAEAAAALGGPTALALEGTGVLPLLKLGLTRRVAPDLVERAIAMLTPALAPATLPDQGVSRPPRVVRAQSRLHVMSEALPTVRIRLLGEFSVHVDDLLVADDALAGGLSARSRTRELLAYLAVNPEGRLREQITADLWPDADIGQDKTLIQITIHRLRQRLFSELLIAREGDPYRLNPAVPLEVDVQRFEHASTAARAASRDVAARDTQLVAAVEAYGGPFLPSCYADWAEFLRRRLERDYLTALAQLMRRDWDAGEYRRCLDWCHRILEVEPDDQAVNARIVECHTRLGEPLVAALHRRGRETRKGNTGTTGTTGSRNAM